MKLLPSKHQSLYLTRLGQWNHLRGVGLLGLLLAVLLQALLAPVAYAATITVNSLADTQADDGECTLVDSINHATSYGNVAEINEGNNLRGPIVSASGQANGLRPATQAVSLEGLPER